MPPHSLLSSELLRLIQSACSPYLSLDTRSTSAHPSSSFTSTLFTISSNSSPNSNVNALIIGCAVGVVSAATQSLGLTLQRKSHLDNDAKPTHLRRPAPRRAMWRIGVLLFLLANIVGSSVQITTLPLIVLSPLQAVGLVFNSLCAAWVLHEPLTIQSVIGTLLVAIGALIVAAWGVISESSKSHNLSELLRLLRRPQFLIWMALSLALVAFVLAMIAHRSRSRKDDGYIVIPNTNIDSLHIINNNNINSNNNNNSKHLNNNNVNNTNNSKIFKFPNNMKTNNPLGNNTNDSEQFPHEYNANFNSNEYSSSPSIDTTAVPESVPENSCDINNNLTSARLRHSSSTTNNNNNNNNSITTIATAQGFNDTNTNKYTRVNGASFFNSTSNNHFINNREVDDEDYIEADGDDSDDDDEDQSLQHIPPKQRLINGLLYAVVCGILSAHSLLMAKSAVEILVRAFVDGKTQDLHHYQSWLIVLAFLGFAVSQLFFMNRGLRLCSTAVLYPLVFCVFNVTSILNSLIYFQQTADMSVLQALMVALGTIFILLGVLLLSWHLGWHDSLALTGEASDSRRESDTQNFNKHSHHHPNHIIRHSVSLSTSRNSSGLVGGIEQTDCDSAATFVSTNGTNHGLNGNQQNNQQSYCQVHNNLSIRGLNQDEIQNQRTHCSNYSSISPRICSYNCTCSGTSPEACSTAATAFDPFQQQQQQQQQLGFLNGNIPYNNNNNNSINTNINQFNDNSNGSDKLPLLQNRHV